VVRLEREAGRQAEVEKQKVGRNMQVERKRLVGREEEASRQRQCRRKKHAVVYRQRDRQVERGRQEVQVGRQKWAGRQEHRQMSREGIR
jgi:hypothetical protein